MADTAVAAAPAANTQRHPLIVLRERLEARRDELKAALPSDITPERFIRALMTAAAINPDIQACTWQTIWIACMQACRDGLLPDGVEGAIVPYKAKASWIPMYQGLLRRFRRSGQFKWVAANIVRQGEEFSHSIDETGEHIRHVPGDNFSAAIVKIYAMATTKDGGLFVTVLPIAEANKMRNMSRASREDAPWKLWPEEMYKKTALRRLSKVLPSARDIMTEEERDDLDDLPTAPPTAPRLPHDGALIEQPYQERASGAGAALEQFAGSPGPTLHAPSEQEEGGGEQRVDDATAPGANDAESSAARSTKQSEATDSAATAARPSEVKASAAEPLLVAYQRGQEAKAAGGKRMAPDEYRKEGHIKECDAWLAGFDGKPQPQQKML